MRIENYLGSKLPLGCGYIKPETFRLPKPGHRDPHFGLSRAAYYKLEKAGVIQMRRVCKKGNLRGVVVIVFDQVLAHVLGAKPGSR